MLFKSKVKGYLLDQGEHVSHLARISSFEAPIVLEALVEFTSTNPDESKIALDKCASPDKTDTRWAWMMLVS